MLMNIMNYINKTPGNTNPAVVRSMVEIEKKKSVYESVEELKKSGRLISIDGVTMKLG